MSQITENIYLGNIGNLNDPNYIKEFDAIMCLTIWNKKPVDINSKPVIYYQVLEDTADFPIENYFERLHKVIDHYVNNNQKILVCCTAGISRSPTIVISYLMAKHHWTYLQALNYVSERRSKVFPNFGFQVALKKWECQLKSNIQ